MERGSAPVRRQPRTPHRRLGCGGSRPPVVKSPGGGISRFVASREREPPGVLRTTLRPGLGLHPPTKGPGKEETPAGKRRVRSRRYTSALRGKEPAGVSIHRYTLAPRVGERRPFYFKAGAETQALLIPPSFRDTILEARFPGTLALGSSVNRVATRLPHVWLSCFWEPTRP